MLLHSFFKIVSTTQQSEKNLVEVEINASHKIFEGHFPGNPVVPGVCLVQMIRETIEVLQHKTFRLKKADEIKFMNMVVPPQNCKLTLEIQQRTKTENPYAYSVIITDGQTVFLKTKMDFSEINHES
ncbi:MAG: 3-hydroxyacyl-ACP dehydratase [Bacteroidota bacterium]